MQGTPFGRYWLVELLGRGGMGEVWRARDTVTDRVVAIKVLPASLSEDAEFQHRFRREAHAAARLDTPHAVPIYDYGEIDGRLFVSMRLITGSDLAAVLADGPLEPARAVRIVDQVAKALHAAHKIGLIHRDIKPSNILLDDDDFVYLIDFGIARAADETRMTKSGNIIGSFAYIAPERLDPQTEEDARADIYSLACVLYEALTGQPPFPGSTAVHLMYAHANTPPPRPSAVQPNVPTNLDEVVVRGMAKEPDSRYATTVELADAARGAITFPTQRPQSSASDPTLPATPMGPTLAATQLSDADLAHNIAQLRGAGAERNVEQQLEGHAQQARMHRTLIIVGAVASLAVIAAVVIIVINNRNDQNSSATVMTTPARATATSASSSAATATTALQTGQVPPLPPFRPSASVGANCQYQATPQEPAAKPVKPPRTGKVPTDPAQLTASMVTSQGNLGLMLANNESPCTVNSFASLMGQRYFINTKCHRLTTSPDLAVLQCGDPRGDGTGGPGYQFANEYPTDQYPPNDPKLQQPVMYPRGTLAMANAGLGTNGSQFFMVYRDSELPPAYTVFGTIDETGLATLDKIAAAGVAGGGQDGPPALDVVINSLLLD